MVADWAPSTEAIAAEVAVYRSGWLDQMRHRVPAAIRLETSGLAMRGLWQMTGLMLVGMALLKLGVLGAGRSPVFYAAMAAVGTSVGIPLVLHGVGRSMASGWDLRVHLATDGLFNYWGGLLVSLSWIATVMLLIRLGCRIRNGRIDRNRMLRAGPPGNCRRDIGYIEHLITIEYRIIVCC